MRLKNKVAILTGCGSGIGEAVSHRFAMEGAKCILADINGEHAKKVALEINNKGGIAHSIQMDVRIPNDRSKTIDLCLKQFLKIDILFNNAAIFEMAPFLESSSDSFDRIFEVNVKGMFFMMQETAKKMVDQNIKGKIINLSSQAGRRGEALVSHYCASKAAVLSYTQSAALALADHGINVNGIAPGVVNTPMWDVVDSLFAKYEKRGLGEKKRIVGSRSSTRKNGLTSRY